MDLTEFFTKWGRAFTEELSGNIRRQMDIAGVGYVPVQERIPVHVKQKGKVKVKPHYRSRTRLLKTGQFNQNVFVFTAKILSLILGLSDDLSRSGVSYSWIARYNDRDSPWLKGTKHDNRIRAIGPKLWPWTTNEMKLMKNWNPMIDELKKESVRQIKEDARLVIQKTIKVTL